jgi:hypothetical protein
LVKIPVFFLINTWHLLFTPVLINRRVTAVWLKMKDGATGMRRRAGIRAHYSATTQQVEGEGECSRGRQM